MWDVGCRIWDVGEGKHGEGHHLETVHGRDLDHTLRAAGRDAATPSTAAKPSAAISAVSTVPSRGCARL